MRLLKGTTFAHPVVSPFMDDVEDNNFQLQQLAVKADGTDYRLALEFELSNAGLLEYIRKDMACYALLMEARSFFYRKLHRPLQDKHEMVIEGHSLSGTVDCIPLVIATTDIPVYTLPGLNDDYKDLKISISSGEVLAISAGRTFVAEKEYDSLQKLSSIMQVIRDDKVILGSMDIDLSQDKITIYVCAQDHEKYSTLISLPEAAPLLMQCLAVPALQEAIVEIRKEAIQGGERRWELMLKKRLEAKKILISDSSPTYIACRLLDGPLSVSLSCLDGLISGGGDE